MIPEEQTANALAKIEKDQVRVAEPEALFAAGNKTEDECINVEIISGVLPKSVVKALKEERKFLAGEVKEAKKRMRERRKNAKHASNSFGDADEATVEASDDEAEGLAKWERMQTIDELLKRHAQQNAGVQP